MQPCRKDTLLQTVVIEAEHRGGATDPMGFRQPCGHNPERLRNPSARLPLPPPRLKAAPASFQVGR